MPALLFLSLSFFGDSALGQDTSASKDSIPNAVSTSKATDTLITKDSLLTKDSISTKDSIAAEGDLETTILYNAEDSIVMDVKTKMVYLYGKAKIDYGDISLEAENIEINWETNIMVAYPGLDSTGKKFGVPIFKDGADVFVVDTIRYNAKTKKGIIKGVVTKQGEGYIHGEKIKKIEDNLYISSAQYTTCDKAHPHFYIKARKLKVIPDEKVVSGPFNMVIADVPTPLGFVLGYFPMPKKRKSGIIFPTIGSSATRGFSMRQGGYYWAVNDYLGLQAVGDAYANGSFRSSLSGKYIKRYSFQGDFALNFSQIKQSFEPTPPAQQDINFQWSHRTLKKRNSNFQANVNAGSSGFYKRNSYNPTTFQQAAFSSAIMYYKAFGNTPFNINASLRQDQDIKTGVMNFTLPELTANMNRVSLFKNVRVRNNGAVESFLKNMNVQYTGNSKIFVTNDTLKNNLDSIYPFNFQNLNLLASKAQIGAKHTVPLNTTIKFRKSFLKNFNFSPGLLFEDWMYQDVDYKLNPTTKRIDVIDTRNFKNAYSYSGSIQVNTNIYGTYKFKWKKLLGIRHTINPSLSFTYRPDLSYQNFKSVLDSNGREVKKSISINSPYGGPASGMSNLLSFNVNNILEAKTKSKKDTTGAAHKFKLLDQLSLNGSYDFARDSFQMSNINITAKSVIAKMVDIYGQAVFDPYARSTVFENGTKRRINKSALSQKQGLANLVSYNLSVGVSLNPDAKIKKYDSKKGSPQELAQINANPLDYIDPKVPWNLRINYNLNYVKNYSILPSSPTTQSITFVGEIALTDKWQVTFNTGYDIVAGKVTTSRIEIYRDLHCWQMSLFIIPAGTIQSYGFTINAKSSLLQDLKLTKKNSNYFGSYY